MSKHTGTPRQSESGNVLFLILIAVALFAALSYAVTQSSRSGAGDASSEKSLVSSSVLTEYPAGIRTSIMRMIVSSSITPDEIMFNSSASFGTAITTGNQKYAVFHAGGGGATYQQASPDLMASSAQGPWHFNALFQVPNIGTTSTSSDTSGNDIVAFLYNVGKGVCAKVDSQLGIGTIPVSGSAFSSTDLQTDQLAASNGSTTSTFPASAGTALTVTGLSGQPYGCFQNAAGGVYVYYHVIIER